MLSNRFINILGRNYRVYDMTDTVLDTGSAYIVGDVLPVLPYMGVYNSPVEKAGIYKESEESDRLLIVLPTYDDAHQYHPNNIVELGTDDIFTKLELQKKDSPVVTEHVNICMPTIKDKDDIFLRLMKFAIAMKQFDIDTAPFEDGSHKSNRKRVLFDQSSLNPEMSVDLARLCELTVGFIIADKEDSGNPMDDDSNTTPGGRNVYYVASNDIDLNSPLVNFKELVVDGESMAQLVQRYKPSVASRYRGEQEDDE